VPPAAVSSELLAQSGFLIDFAAMRRDELWYALPVELIAQRPAERRDASRMLLLERKTGELMDREFRDLPNLLRGDELLVLNNARVLPARLLGQRIGVHSQAASRATRQEHLSGVVEVFLTRRISPDVWEALVRPGRKMQIGERVLFGAGELECEITERGELGLRQIEFVSRTQESVDELISKLGHVPLPPYIDREDEVSDRERYQTVFAKNTGAVAAPTAGLHFTPEILGQARSRGVEICELTLDVGLGTFQPIHEEELENHKMHAESYEIPEETAEGIAAARASGRTIVAIGTTVVRALENSALLAEAGGRGKLLEAGPAEARLFITPGFSFRVVDVLLTNFHFPGSTLLALVCAFAGREAAMRAYRHAIAERYRFYSYGDCMLIR
jgi:S-adenosylmethionine:tRNA ribosyltransferase-isomerase